MSTANTPLLFNAFVMNTGSHIQHGQWRHPEARAAMRGLCDAVMGIIFAELVRGKPDVSTVRITMRRIGHGEVATLIALNDARARTLDADGRK